MEGWHEDFSDEVFPIELYEDFEPRIETQTQELVYPW